MSFARLEALQRQSYNLGCADRADAEFEALRKLGPKLSRAQSRRMRHLERHLDLGENVCDCYETLRTDVSTD